MRINIGLIFKWGVVSNFDANSTKISGVYSPIINWGFFKRVALVGGWIFWQPCDSIILKYKWCNLIKFVSWKRIEERQIRGGNKRERKGKEKSLSRIPFLYGEQNKESMMYETVIHYVTIVLALAGTMLQLKLQLVNKLHPLVFFLLDFMAVF